MWTTKTWFRMTIVGAAVGTAALLAAAIGTEAKAAAPEKPVAGKQVHFPQGTWSAVPQAGPDGKVMQCNLVALRSRAAPAGGIDTRLSLTIGRGAGFAFGLADGQMPAEDILDDQAEIVVDGHSFPAVAFTVAASNNLALHPGDAAGVLAALAKATTLRLHSAGDGIDTGAIALDLPGDALAWLELCGKVFAIAVDRPTDPKAPALPVPRPPSPEIAFPAPTPAGPPGIDDKQKISGWDASELRGGEGKVTACMIRQHYTTGSGPDQRAIGTFLIDTPSKGFTLMLKDSSLFLTPGPLTATLTIDGKSFADFSTQMLSKDEIGLFPQHGAALALALGDGAALAFKSPVEGMEFPIPSGVVPWLRACTHRWGFGFEPQPAKP